MKPYKHIPLLFLIFLITFSSTVFASSPVLKNGLGLGDNGEQVKILQSKLSEDKTLYPSGLISGYYGNLTQQAVKKFQQKYSLIQTGNLDANTLEKFNQIYGDNIQPTPTPVPKKNIIKSFFDFITSPIRSIISLFNRINNNNQSTENSSQTAEVPTRIPTPTTYYISPTIDPDPFVNCGISTECGGGTKLLRSSICSQSSCCQINGKWIYYDSVDKCKQDQNSVNIQNSQNNNSGNNNQNQYTPTYFPSTPTIDCVVSYPCNGTSYTNKLTQSDCDHFQLLAKQTCEYKATLNQMYDTSHPTYVLPKADPIKVPVTFCHDQVVQIGGNAATTTRVCDTSVLQ